MFLGVKVGQRHGHHGRLVDIVTARPLGRISAAGEPLLDGGDARGKHRIGLRGLGLDERQGNHGRLAHLFVGCSRAQVLNSRKDRLFLLCPGLGSH